VSKVNPVRGKTRVKSDITQSRYAKTGTVEYSTVQSLGNVYPICLFLEVSIPNRYIAKVPVCTFSILSYMNCTVILCTGIYKGKCIPF
jgi:hypothetical protein